MEATRRSASRSGPRKGTSQPAASIGACGPAALTTPAAAADQAAADALLAAYAKAIGHPTRVRILRLLASKQARLCSHIVDELPIAQSTVSEHLRLLRRAGLAQSNQARPHAGYCIVPGALDQFKRLLHAL